MPELAQLLNDDQYNAYIRQIKPAVRGLRRRGLLGALHRAMAQVKQQSFTGVEVGVKFGTLSQQILESLPQVRRMVLVDPWKEYAADHTDREKFSYAKRTQRGWDNMAQDCANRMQPFGKRVKILRMTSLDAAKALYTQRFFFVYIDASHAFEDVLMDCMAWWNLVEPGGYLCGDDYREPGHRERTESVGKAVEKFAATVGGKIVAHHRNWFLRKP